MNQERDLLERKSPAACGHREKKSDQRKMIKKIREVALPVRINVHNRDTINNDKYIHMTPMMTMKRRSLLLTAARRLYNA